MEANLRRWESSWGGERPSSKHRTELLAIGRGTVRWGKGNRWKWCSQKAEGGQVEEGG